MAMKGKAKNNCNEEAKIGEMVNKRSK